MSCSELGLSVWLDCFRQVAQCAHRLAHSLSLASIEQLCAVILSVDYQADSDAAPDATAVVVVVCSLCNGNI